MNAILVHIVFKFLCQSSVVLIDAKVSFLMSLFTEFDAITAKYASSTKEQLICQLITDN